MSGERFRTLLSSEASSTMRALASARCTDARLYTYQIKIGTSQRAPGELSHYFNSPLVYMSMPKTTVDVR